MLTEQQLKERLSYIGSSDAPGVLAMSQWKTPLSVWAEKTGQIAIKDEKTLRMRIGHKMEDDIAELFEEETGKKVEVMNETMFHVEHPFLAANIDRRIVGENAILEIKTSAAWRKNDWKEDEIPSDYLIQVYHQLAVTGFPMAYICVLIGNEDLKIKPIPRDEKVIKNIVDREVHFWNEFVVPKVMPGVVTKRDTDILAELFPVAEAGKEIVLPDQANVLVENLQAYKADLKHLEGLISGAENELKLMLGTAESGVTALNRVFWFNKKTASFRAKDFEKEYPDLKEKFMKRGVTRQFTYKSLLGGEKNGDNSRDAKGT